MPTRRHLRNFSTFVKTSTLKTLKPAVVALLLIHYTVISHAQDDFRDGFIVDNNKEYIYGFISFTDKPHLGCIFKKTRDAAPSIYGPDQIQAYGVINGNHFRRKLIALDGEIDERQIFVEAIADGTITLYSAFNRLFIERGASFYELKTDKANLESYRSTIASLTGDCEKVSRKAKKVSIEKYALVELVNAYNMCAASGTTTFVKERSRHEVGVLAGLDRTRFSMTSGNDDDFNGRAFTDRTLAAGGILYSLKPKQYQIIGFTTGLWFNDQRFYLIAKNFSTYQTIQTYRFNSRTIRVPFLIEVSNITSSRIQPYVKAGISIPFMLKIDNSVTHEKQQETVIYIDKFNAAPEFKEPIFLHGLAGVVLPISGNVSFRSELTYTIGKNKLELNGPARGEVKARYSSLAFNLGLFRKF
jgi:hypothetical protein